MRGSTGPKLRAFLLARLRQRFRIVAPSRLHSTARRLGLPFRRGRSLARIARSAGVFAVVVGRADARRLTVAVLGAKRGRVLLRRRSSWRSRRGRLRSWRRVAKAVNAALRRARPPRHRAVRRQRPQPMRFPPETVRRGSTEDETLDYRPGAPAAARSPTLRAAGQGGTGVKPPPRLALRGGLGIWTRRFTLRAPAANRPHGEYSSGAAAALQLSLFGRPLSFFSDGVVANFWAQLDFQSSLGLSSDAPGVEGSFGTSMWQLLFGLGYRWNILATSASPELDFGLGFGVLDFGIDWASTPQQVANVGYGFFRLGTAVAVPFLRMAMGDASVVPWLQELRATFGLNYRAAFGTGQVTEDAWYGPGSSSGFDLSLALDWPLGHFAIRLAYELIWMSTGFDDDQAPRIAADKLAADGATDVYHSMMLGVGYAL